MKGTVKDLTIGGYECSLYLPQEYFAHEENYPVVYINGETDLNDIIGGIEPDFGVGCRAFIALGIQPESWNKDFTPWPAPPLSKKEEPFGGNALKYLEFLANIVKPYIDAHYRTKPEFENTGLIGYSLAGLTALYALYTGSTFGNIGSLSGSLWYEGWAEFMDSNMPVNTGARVYLSLGKMEEHSRNQRMATVGNCTRKAALILKEQLTYKSNIILEWNDGGHFAEIPQRYKQALLWLMQEGRRGL